MSKMEDSDLVNYIINQEATGKEAAEYFGVSLSTVRKKLASIKGSLSSETSIYKELEEVARKNEQKGKVEGGRSLNSGPKRMLSLVEVVKIAMEIIVNNFTIEEAAIRYSIPSSTLADNLEVLNSSEYHQLYKDLKSLFEAHKLRKSTTKLQMKYLEQMQALESKKRK